MQCRRAYIAGYLLRKGQAKHTCAQCSRELEKPEKAVVHDREILCGLNSYTGQDDTDVGSLLKPTQAFHDVVVRAYEVVQGLSPSIFWRAGIRAQLREYLCETEATRSLASALCDGNCLTFILDLFKRL